MVKFKINNKEVQGNKEDTIWKIAKSNGINIPHPRMHLRNFVLIPLFEIEKTWKYPNSKRSIKNLIFSLSNSDIRSIKLV